jgi:hypothetical protein
MSLDDVKSLKVAALAEMRRNLVNGGRPYHLAAAWWMAAAYVEDRIYRRANLATAGSVEHHLAMADREHAS